MGRACRSYAVWVERVLAFEYLLDARRCIKKGCTKSGAIGERSLGFTADPVYGRAKCLPMLGSLKT
jgi:hypothetical protein